MQSVLYVDSRMRSEGTDSSFQIDLQESKHLDSHGMRLDKIRFVNTFFTTDLGAHLYYKDGSEGLQYYSIPEQAYTGLHGSVVGRCDPRRDGSDDHVRR